jgi:hypothetical protein
LAERPELREIEARIDVIRVASQTDSFTNMGSKQLKSVRL